ncbi:MAG: hypothetical protein IJ594_04760 [Oscillospiraceae bacterium]|nr:hypothetical protein [Oscillospiraceae bacterium]
MSEDFNYSYSAERQAEVEAIRRKYLPPEEQENKLERLRRLDASVGVPAMIASLALGIVSILVFGLGMCCFLLWTQWAAGAAACLIGAAGMLYAPRLYARLLQARREKLAPEILRLTDELSQR